MGISHFRACQKLGRRPLNRAQWEPHFVAHLCASMADVASVWRSILGASRPNLKLTLSSVFTHQTPCVTWTPTTGGSKRCELADLLIVMIDRSAVAPSGIATLIQVKQSDTGHIRLTTRSEKTQFELLSERPVFNVDSTDAPKAIDLSGCNPDAALLYGLNPPDCLPLMSHVLPSPRWKTADKLGASIGAYSVISSSSMGRTLVNLIQGMQGWPFNLSPKGKDWRFFSKGGARDDWAMLINYLLERSFKAPVKALITAGTQGMRREEHTMYLHSLSQAGNRMFFLQNRSDNITEPHPFDWFNEISDGISEDQNDEQMAEVSSETPWAEYSDGGDRFTGMAQSENQEPENGPVSVIAFEFSQTQDHN